MREERAREEDKKQREVNVYPSACRVKDAGSIRVDLH